MSLWRFGLIAILGVSLASARASAQPVLGQTDTFQDGTTQGWTNGNPAADPINVVTGGPAGVGDRYLQIATTGAAGGAGSRLIAFNATQWLGNYTAAGITGIQLDARNFNFPAGFSLRVGLRSGSFGYLSAPVTIPQDGLWHRATFDLTTMVPFGSPPPLATVLAGSHNQFRILHSVAADINGDTTAPIAAQLGVDNVSAIVVPEPGALLLTGAAVAWAVGSIRRNRREPGA